jgi:6-phosphogluconolactonase (cycloisomerase 2 family)
VAVSVEPTGRFAYVGASDGPLPNNVVKAYSIDPTFGTLSEISSSPFATVAVPYSVTTDVSGKFVYVAGQGGGASGYDVDPVTGVLSPITGSPFPAGSASISVTTVGKVQ